MIRRRAAGLGLGSLFLGTKARAAGPDVAPTHPSTPPPPNLPALPPTVRPGRDVVSLMGGALIGTYVKIISDISDVLAQYVPDAPRVLPVISNGGLQVAYDLLELDFIDGAVLSGVLLDVVYRGGWLPELTKRLSYVTELYFEETHILSTQLIDNIYSLGGQTVNVGPLGGGTDVIARRLFERLGIRPIFDNRPTLVALKGVSTGHPAAVLFVAGKPVSLFRDIRIVGNLRFVPIPWNAVLQQRLAPLFHPTFLRNTDYPRLVPPGSSVPTVASSVYLVTIVLPPGSPRQRAISAMITALLQNLMILQNGPYQPKWSEANVLAHLPHFRRAPEVLTWFNNSNDPSR